MKTLTMLVPCALAWLGASLASAQPVDPDRPDLTTSAKVVGTGRLQLETGFDYEQERVGGSPTEKRLTLQATLRAGVTDALELSLETEPYVWRWSGGDDDSGSGDYTLGSKYRFFTPAPGSGAPLLGLRSYVKLPTASEPVGTGRPDFGEILLMTLGLPWGLSLDANAGVAAIGVTRPNGFIPQGIVSGSLSWAVTERLSTTTELFFTTKAERDAHASLLTTVALMYQVTPDLALDIGARSALAGPGPDWAVLGGLTVRFAR
ncbi:MAG TPA: transporter [Methylomirabilota bacterium]|nr:transporter [Methylomirabilota bacterium]